MTSRRPWFYKVEGTSDRYRPTGWQGAAVIVTAVLSALALPFALARIWPWAGIVTLPIWLPIVLAVLFAVMRRRAGPLGD